MPALRLPTALLLAFQATLLFAQVGPDGDEHWDGRFAVGRIGRAGSVVQPAEATVVAVDSLHAWFGGRFEMASGRIVNNIVRVHRATGRMDRLGTAAASGVNGHVNAIVPVAGGVYVGGYFTHAGVDSVGAGGVETGPLAFFDGKAWKKAGPPLTILPARSEVSAIAVGPGGLFASGTFDKGGDTALGGIGMLDGGVWKPLWDQGRLAQGTDGGVTRMVLTASALYVGGNFTRAGGRSVAHVARWNWTNETWDAMKGGMSHSPEYPGVDDMDIDGVGRIWVGAKGLLYYDVKADTGWTLVEGTGGNIIRRMALTTPFGTLAQGSGDLFGGGTMALLTAKGWTPVEDRKLGFGFSNQPDLVSDGQRVWIGSDGGVSGAAGMAWFDGKQFGAIGNGVRETRDGGLGIYAFAELDGKLIAGGSFSHLGNTAAEGVARWNGNAWESLASPYESVWRLAEFKGTLYAAGTLQKKNEAVAGGLARYIGTGWEIVPGFEKVNVSAIASSSKYLWLGGVEIAEGNVRGQLARWDGSKLEVVPSALKLANGELATPQSIVPYWGDGACVAGLFTSVGTQSSSGVACTDGKAWVTLGGPFQSGIATVLAALGNDLYAGGTLVLKDGRKYLARWNGKEWASVGENLDGLVAGLHANGNDLYVTGYFRKAGDLAASGVARWNGMSWSALGSGVTDPAAGVAFVGPGGLWLAGGFHEAGTAPSDGVGLYANVAKKEPLPMGIVRGTGPVAGKSPAILRRGHGGIEALRGGKSTRVDGRHQMAGADGKSQPTGVP